MVNNELGAITSDSHWRTGPWSKDLHSAACWRHKPRAPRGMLLSIRRTPSSRTRIPRGLSLRGRAHPPGIPSLDGGGELRRLLRAGRDGEPASTDGPEPELLLDPEEELEASLADSAWTGMRASGRPRGLLQSHPGRSLQRPPARLVVPDGRVGAAGPLSELPLRHPPRLAQCPYAASRRHLSSSDRFPHDTREQNVLNLS